MFALSGSVNYIEKQKKKRLLILNQNIWQHIIILWRFKYFNLRTCFCQEKALQKENWFHEINAQIFKENI